MLAGLEADLYYVREGEINEYALNFTVPIPVDIKDIVFTWQSLAKKPVSSNFCRSNFNFKCELYCPQLSYVIKISTSDSRVLPQPSMNISKKGEIPREEETFSIGLRCSGFRNAEVEVVITIEITQNSVPKNVTELVFKRKKTCLEGVKQTEQMDPLETFAEPPNSFITLIIGTIVAIMLVILLVTLACCVRGKSKRQPNLAQPVRTSSFQRLQAHSSSQALSVCPSNVEPLIKSFDIDDLHKRILEISVQRCRVRLLSLLQEGTFGRIYKGNYNDGHVLVKTIGQQANQIQINLMLQEGMHLQSISHPALLTVFGVSLEDETAPFLLYQIENNARNLKIFLQEPIARTLTTIQIVKMSTQIASGISHLHSRRILHRDIAARNCV